MYEKKKYGILKAGVIICIVLGIVFGMVVNQPQPYQKSWHTVFEGSLSALAMELANPGSGTSGILAIYIMNATGTNDDARDTNSSYTVQGWCNTSGLGYCNADNSMIDIAHTTNFEIWVYVRGNSSVCKRGATWWDSDVKVEITSTDLSIAADTDCENHVAGNNSAWDYLYVMCCLEGPYTIAKGAAVGDAEIDSIKLSFYY
jgi:hypothetical protein